MSGTETILLADESRFFLTIEKQFLRNVPVSVLEARSSAEVLSLAREQRPGLIYMAQELPDPDGVDCCRQLKADPQLRSIPVVMICSEDSEPLFEACRRAGCDAVLAKPLDRTRFLDIGRSFLAGIRERRRPCLLRVRARCGSRLFAARGLDLSSGGLFLQTDEDLPVGSVLHLDLLLSGRDEAEQWFSCSGVIAWRNDAATPLKPSHPVGYGIKFEPLPAPGGGALKRYLHTLEAGGTGRL